MVDDQGSPVKDRAAVARAGVIAGQKAVVDGRAGLSRGDADRRAGKTCAVNQADVVERQIGAAKEKEDLARIFAAQRDQSTAVNRHRFVSRVRIDRHHHRRWATVEGDGPPGGHRIAQGVGRVLALTTGRRPAADDDLGRSGLMAAPFEQAHPVPIGALGVGQRRSPSQAGH